MYNCCLLPTHLLNTFSVVYIVCDVRLGVSGSQLVGEACTFCQGGASWYRKVVILNIL